MSTILYLQQNTVAAPQDARMLLHVQEPTQWTTAAASDVLVTSIDVPQINSEIVRGDEIDAIRAHGDGVDVVSMGICVSACLLVHDVFLVRPDQPRKAEIA